MTARIWPDASGWEAPKTPPTRVLGEAASRRCAQPPHLTDGPVLTALTVVLALLIAAH